jgi:hypothetical protein
MVVCRHPPHFFCHLIREIQLFAWFKGMMLGGKKEEGRGETEHMKSRCGGRAGRRAKDHGSQDRFLFLPYYSML